MKKVPRGDEKQRWSTISLAAAAVRPVITIGVGTRKPVRAFSFGRLIDSCMGSASGISSRESVSAMTRRRMSPSLESLSSATMASTFLPGSWRTILTWADEVRCSRMSGLSWILGKPPFGAVVKAVVLCVWFVDGLGVGVSISVFSSMSAGAGCLVKDRALMTDVVLGRTVNGLSSSFWMNTSWFVRAGCGAEAVISKVVMSSSSSLSGCAASCLLAGFCRLGVVASVAVRLRGAVICSPVVWGRDRWLRFLVSGDATARWERSGAGEASIWLGFFHGY